MGNVVTGLYLRNFKCFGLEQEIEIAPITLLFGPNSAGKSAITDALLLLRQTLDSRPQSLSELVSNGPLVSLGGFEDFVFKHKVDSRVEIGVRRYHELEIDEDEDAAEALQVLNAAGVLPPGCVDLCFRFAFEKSKAGGAILRSFSIGGPDWHSDALSYSNVEGRRAHDKRELLEGVSDKVLISLLTAHLVEEHLELVERCLGEVKERRQKTEGAGNERGSLTLGSELRSKMIEFLVELGPGGGFGKLDTRISVSGFLPSPQAWSRGRSFELHVERSEHESDAPPLVYAVSAALGKALSEMSYLGPLREPPRRLVEGYRGSATDVGPHGENMIQVLAAGGSEIEERVNEWLGRMEAGYRLRVHRGSGDADSHVLGIRLFDQRNETEVSFPDVGFGFSQFLPILVQCAVTQGRLQVVRQPELHLHPRMQAEIGDVFIDSALSGCNRIVVETHSEHLLLRILRRVREGYSPSGSIEVLDPGQVAVYYVEPTPNGSHCIRMPINGKGEFTRPWPGGFFPERVKEMF